MDLRQMRYFLAVAQERNFGRAASRLHIAQPPLTRQIRAIEEDLGTALFVRTTKGVELTKAGEALLGEVPNLLSLAQRARERAKLAGQGVIGHLDVAIFGSSILNAIPLLLARFHEARPGIGIKLHNMTKVEQIEALRDGRITVGFNRLVPNEVDLGVEVVLRERLMVALHEDHRLAAKSRIAICDLAHEPMILYPNVPLPGLAQQVIGAFQQEDVPLCIEHQVEDVLTCIALVSAGFGLCVTTESAQNLRLPRVVYRPLRAQHLRDIELSCLYRRGDDSPVLAAFLAIIRNYGRRRNSP
jgi:DNA-binding transcriptional LysR family regulator